MGVWELQVESRVFPSANNIGHHRITVSVGITQKGKCFRVSQTPSPTVDDGVHFFQSFVWLMFRMGGKTKTLYLLDSTEGHVCVKKGSIVGELRR